MATLLIYDAYDEVAVAEDVAKTLELNPTVNDAVGITESESADPDKVISVADTITLTEYKAATHALNAGVNDTASVTEYVAQKKGLSYLPGISVITLQAIGNVNWSWLESFPGHPQGIKIHAIVVMAAGAETFALRDGSATGPMWFKNVCTAAEYKVVPISYTGLRLRPYMVITDLSGVSPASKYAILFDR